MNKLSQISMKNLKLNFIDDNIKYEEYYFSGLSAPKDIQVNDINSNSCNVTWKIDDINGTNKNEIKIYNRIKKRK